MVSGNLIQVADELEEASRVCGATWGQTLKNVVLPLWKTGLANSFIYTFINCIRELGAVVLLVTPESIVLMTLLLNLYANHAIALNKIAAASVMISVVIVIILVLSMMIANRLTVRARRAKGDKERAPDQI
jgi:iron(III) transport system permease protein